VCGRCVSLLFLSPRPRQDTLTEAELSALGISSAPTFLIYSYTKRTHNVQLSTKERLLTLLKRAKILDDTSAANLLDG
jgi:hypothetical protein